MRYCSIGGSQDSGLYQGRQPQRAVESAGMGTWRG